MIQNISNLIAANVILSWVIATFIATLIALTNNKIRYSLIDMWISLPWIGTIARIAKDVKNGNNGWKRSEESICLIYNNRIEALLNKNDFDDHIMYLSKATDNGRTPTPILVWLLLVILVIAEGLGFSYLLGSWMARDGSANTHTLLMLAIVLVICVIMVALTHAAGHQYHRTSLLRACFKRYQDTGDEYAKEAVELNKDQSIDDKGPDYKQILNRVADHSGDVGSYGWVVTAIITIAFIAILSTEMRYQNFQVELTRDTTTQSASSSGNPFETLPDEVTAPQQAADKKAVDDVKNSTEIEGLSAFMMLGFIFVITQIVGMGAGYRFGFVGNNSKQAYKMTGGCKNYQEYWAKFEPIINNGNSKLKDLQQQMEEKSHQKLALTKTFSNYLEEKNAATRQHQDKINENNIRPTEKVNSTGAVLSSVEEAKITPTIDPVEDAKKAILGLSDKNEQMAYFKGLSQEVREALKPWLQARKKAEEENISDLF